MSFSRMSACSGNDKVTIKLNPIILKIPAEDTSFHNKLPDFSLCGMRPGKLVEISMLAPGFNSDQISEEKKQLVIFLKRFDIFREDY